MNESAPDQVEPVSAKLRLVSVNQNPQAGNRILRLLKRQYPSFLVISLVIAGLIVANVTDFRIGTYILASALGLATFFRLTFSRFAVGWLAVRHRALDTSILLIFTVLLVALAIVVPA
jgi:hypothetical protein